MSYCADFSHLVSSLLVFKSRVEDGTYQIHSIYSFDERLETETTAIKATLCDRRANSNQQRGFIDAFSHLLSMIILNFGFYAKKLSC